MAGEDTRYSGASLNGMLPHGASTDRIRLLLSGPWSPFGRGGGGVRGGTEVKKKVCVPKINVKFPAPLINFLFPLRKLVLMWADGWGWQGPTRPPPSPSGH